MKKLILFLFVLSFIDLLGQCSNLPAEFPDNSISLDGKNLTIAKCFAPVVHQMAEKGQDWSVSGRADLLTAVNYDNDWNTNNNWERLDNYESGATISIDELDPVVYYSVVWTDEAWIITYGFYHPRDYAPNTLLCCGGGGQFSGDSHENDFEGAILVVSRTEENSDGDKTYPVIGGFSISHHELKYYLSISEKPEVFIDNRTHAVELNIGSGGIKSPFWPCDDDRSFDTHHIEYSQTELGVPYVDAFEIPNSDFLAGTGEYILENIFGGVESLDGQRNNTSVFNGDNFADSSIGCVANGGSASAPWGWGQLDYSNSTIQAIVCFAKSGLFGGLACLQNPPLVIDNPYQEYDCTLNSGSIIIDSHTEYNNIQAAVTNITVLPGNTLTIKDSNFDFSPNGFIDIRSGASLVIDNSVLDKCEESRWQGIKAFSQNATSNTGEIRITNNSEIRGANIGLAIGSNSSSILSWGRSWLFIDNSLFYNNLKGVSFIASFSRAKISNVEFRSVEESISMLASTGVNIDNCSFYGSEMTSAVDALNSSFKCLDNNLFYQTWVGISNFGIFPFSSGATIGSENTNANHFTQIGAGVINYGSDYPTGVQLTNNLFFDCPFGSYYVGVNKFNNSNNSYTRTSNGTSALTTGNNFNNINCNEYNQTSSKGVHVQGQNVNSVFLGNSFSTMVSSSRADIELEDYSIPNIIGSADNPAENCFSSNGNAKDIFVSVPGNSFDYHYYSNGPDCQKPEEVPEFIIRESQENPSNCFKVGVFNFIDPDGDGEDGLDGDSLHIPTDACLSCILDSIDTWILKVIDVGGDDPRTNFDEDDNIFTVLKFNSNRILNQWISYGLFVSLETNDFDFADEILTPLQSWEWQSKLYGVKIIQRDFDSALSILNNLPETNLNEAYFKDVQNIYLKVLFYKGDGVSEIDSSDLEHLVTIAYSEFPVKGYAVSLYKYITGINLLFPEIDEDLDPRSIAKSNEPSKNGRSEIILYPNPAKDKVSVGNSPQEINKITIFNWAGEVLVVKIPKDSDDLTIDISPFPTGVLIVQCQFVDGKKQSSKLIKY